MWTDENLSTIEVRWEGLDWCFCMVNYILEMCREDVRNLMRKEVWREVIMINSFG